jgi:lipopolysaccharide export system permease protein
MKKIDKLIFKSFLGPFILTFLVVVFILLLQTMLRYFDQFFGKGLDFMVFVEMFFYFSLNTTPIALPLAVLLSSLMTYGNLGEYNELTAIKGSGISLTRTLVPIFIFSVLLAGAAYLFNNRIVPKANLKAYALLYDVKQKKPTLEFKEGAFYGGLEGFSIKVSKKYPDGKTLKGLMIYDHTDHMGNIKVILADSGKMYISDDERYLTIEMFRGNIFSENINTTGRSNKQFVRSGFDESKIIFNMATFDFTQTPEAAFSSNKLMKTVDQLSSDVDSMKNVTKEIQVELNNAVAPYYYYHNQVRTDTIKYAGMQKVLERKTLTKDEKEAILLNALNNARTLNSVLNGYKERISKNIRDTNSYETEKYKKYTFAFSVITMFLIGAPLGAIIKKGGLGIPVIISILFFIIFYVITIMGEKWAKESLITVPFAAWGANIILLPIGLFFLRQARNDARLFDTDYYNVVIGKIKNRFRVS